MTGGFFCVTITTISTTHTTAATIIPPNINLAVSRTELWEATCVWLDWAVSGVCLFRFFFFFTFVSTQMEMQGCMQWIVEGNGLYK